MSMGKRAFAMASTEETFSRMFGNKLNNEPDEQSSDKGRTEASSSTQEAPSPVIEIDLDHREEKTSEEKPVLFEPAEKPDTGSVASVPAPNKTETQRRETKAKAKKPCASKNEVEPGTVKKSFYLTEDIVKALKRRAFREDDLNFSKYAREAFEEYLKDDLKAVREEKAKEVDK